MLSKKKKKEKKREKKSEDLENGRFLLRDWKLQNIKLFTWNYADLVG